LLAARKLDLAHVPVIVLDHLTATQKRAFLLADNRLTELGGWNDELLAAELASLEADGFDVGLTGFSPDVARALSRAQFLRVRHFSVSAAANFDGGTYSPDLSGPPG
jgi:ParB-like chromosome segregation protein Spo0J